MNEPKICGGKLVPANQKCMRVLFFEAIRISLAPTIGELSPPQLSGNYRQSHQDIRQMLRMAGISHARPSGHSPKLSIAKL
jgi:hypothetical protein